MSLPPVLERALRAMPWLTVTRAPMAERGRYYPQHRTILIRRGLRGPAYFSTLAHELVHAEREHAPCLTPELEARQEAIVVRDAARLLIDIRDLGEAAAAYPQDSERIAEELDVDVDTLRARVAHLHPSERHYLKRRLEHTEESA